MTVSIKTYVPPGYEAEYKALGMTTVYEFDDASTLHIKTEKGLVLETIPLQGARAERVPHFVETIMGAGADLGDVTFTDARGTSRTISDLSNVQAFLDAVNKTSAKQHAAETSVAAEQPDITRTP